MAMCAMPWIHSRRRGSVPGRSSAEVSTVIRSCLSKRRSPTTTTRLTINPYVSIILRDDEAFRQSILQGSGGVLQSSGWEARGKTQEKHSSKDWRDRLVRKVSGSSAGRRGAPRGSGVPGALPVFPRCLCCVSAVARSARGTRRSRAWAGGRREARRTPMRDRWHRGTGCAVRRALPTACRRPRTAAPD